MTNIEDVPDADATEGDGMQEQLPTAMPDDQPADGALDPSFVPMDEFDEGFEVET